jgi:hypothetical protein
MNWDIVVFFAFLLINLVIGLYHGRKVKTIEDYALGGRNFTTGALVSTIVATWIGGDYLFITLAEVYKTGLHYTIGCLGMVACLLLNAYVFVPKMQEFLGSISVAESMGKLYGEKVRIISAISGTVASAGFIAVQFKVFGAILTHYVGLSGDYPIFIAASIVVAYSAFGGIRSVAFTDVIQFFTFGVLIPVLGFVIWSETAVNFTLSYDPIHPLFNYKEFLGLSNPKFWSLILLFLLFSLPDLNPTMFQRVAIGRTIPQVKKAFAISSFILLFILLGIAWIAFLLHRINPNLQPETLVQYIIDQYSPHAGLRSFILIGVVAMCMSTADSNINSSSVLLTHDFCHPLGIRFKNELVLSKIIAVMLGVLSIYLALLDFDLLPLVFMTQSFYIPIIDVPLILAILGFRSTTKAVLIGMGAGLIGVIVWRIFFMDSTGVDSILPGMLINLIFFMGSHYLLKQEGGWVKVNPSVVKYSKFMQVLHLIKGFNFLDFCKKNSPKNELGYSSFGFFCLISTFCTMYSVSGNFDRQSLLGVYETILAISICFATYPIWPLSLKNETMIQVLWNIGLVILLVICSTFFVLLSDFSHLQFTIFILNIVVLAILTRWNVTFILISIGSFLAIAIYRQYIGKDFNIVIEDTQFIIYSFLLIATAIIIFVKPRQQIEETLDLLNKNMEFREQEQYKNLIKSLQHQVEFVKSIDDSCIKVFESTNDQVKELNLKLKNGIDTQEEVIAISNQLFLATEKLRRGGDYLSEIIYNIQNLIKLKIKTINYKQLVENIIKEFSVSSRVSFIFEKNENDLDIDCDRLLINNVFKDLIANIITTNKEDITIKVMAERDLIQYQLSFTKEYAKKIEAIKFSIIIPGKELSESKISSLLIDSYSSIEEMVFINIRRIISAHYGSFNIKNSQEGVVYSFTIPIKINEIRPKLMDIPNVRLENIDNIANLTKKMVKERVLEIAKALKKMGLSSDIIVKITKLTKEEILNLAI